MFLNLYLAYKPNMCLLTTYTLTYTMSATHATGHLQFVIEPLMLLKTLDLLYLK